MIKGFTLECTEGLLQGRRFTFPGCGTFRVGRTKDFDLPVPDCTVSAKHCLLLADGQSVWLQDCGSTNGTLRNGEAVTEVLLQDGDSFTIGGACSFRFTAEEGIDSRTEAVIEEIVRRIRPGNP